jgi:hypothetical protein
MSVWQDVEGPKEKSQEELEQERSEERARNSIEVEVEGETPVAKKVGKVEAPEIEVVDDTPQNDRGRGPAAPPPDVTEQELEGYSDKVKKRMSHLMRGYHDERRVKEQALRERQAAEEFAQAQIKRAKELEAKLAELETRAVTASKGQIDAELAQAKRDYREAYDAGDTDKLAEANDRLIDLRMKLGEVSRAPVVAAEKETSLQKREDTVYSNQNVPEQTAATPDPKAIAWSIENPWYGKERLMTMFAQGLHVDLLEKGFDPTSEEYYSTINSKVRQAFPEYNWADDELEDVAPEPANKGRAEKKPATVVAGASRATPARKVKLTQSQVSIARRLGVSLEDYARQVADLNNGGR